METLVKYNGSSRVMIYDYNDNVSMCSHQP